MNQEKQRPSLDAVIMTALKGNIVAKQGPQYPADMRNECIVTQSMMTGLSMHSGYSSEELYRRLTYLIDDGVLRRRANVQSKEHIIVSIVDLDAKARELGVSHYFTSSMPK